MLIVTKSCVHLQNYLRYSLKLWDIGKYVTLSSKIIVIQLSCWLYIKSFCAVSVCMQINIRAHDIYMIHDQFIVAWLDSLVNTC